MIARVFLPLALKRKAMIQTKASNDSPSFSWIIGWGSTQYEGFAAPTLMQVAVPITNNSGCLSKISASSKQICAGYDEGGKDSCQGDSGGPLMIDNDRGIFELVGLVSFGVRCAEAMKPGRNIERFDLCKTSSPGICFIVIFSLAFSLLFLMIGRIKSQSEEHAETPREREREKKEENLFVSRHCCCFSLSLINDLLV